MLYANYLRNKMRHLFKIVFADGYPLKIISKFNKKTVDYTIHGKTETGKNILPYPYSGFGGATTKTVNGITFTDNGDGSITMNGTSTAEKYFEFMLNMDFINSIDKTKTYTMSVTGINTTKIGFEVLLWLNSTWVENVCTTAKPTCDFSTYTKEFNKSRVALIIKQGASFENFTVKPQIELGETATEYEPYTEYGVGDKTKNIIPYPYDGFEGETTKTVNGITFTDNGDGTITINGTTGSSQVDFKFITSEIRLPSDSSNYVLSGRVNNKAYVYTIATGANDAWYQMISESIFDSINTDTYNALSYMKITCAENSEFNNVVIKPQLEIGESEAATEYERYGYKIPVTNAGKNLIPYPYKETTKTTNGIAFTDNGDGTITANGTATAMTTFTLSVDTSIFEVGKTYTISDGVNNADYFVRIIVNGVQVGVAGTKPTFTVSENITSLVLAIRISEGAVLDNVIFKPQIELGETATEYEPYREPQTATIYHTSPLKQGESISYKTDNLPDLQLCKGENNITADTEVKPSAIDVKYLN